MDELIDVVASGFAVVTVISLVFISLQILIFIEHRTGFRFESTKK